MFARVAPGALDGSDMIEGTAGWHETLLWLVGRLNDDSLHDAAPRWHSDHTSTEVMVGLHGTQPKVIDIYGRLAVTDLIFEGQASIDEMEPLGQCLTVQALRTRATSLSRFVSSAGYPRSKKTCALDAALKSKPCSTPHLLMRLRGSNWRRFPPTAGPPSKPSFVSSSTKCSAMKSV